MKFSDFIILEQVEKTPRDRKYLYMISSAVKGSQNPEELEKFYNKVLPEKFTQEDLNLLNSLVRSFNQKKSYLEKSDLLQYNSIQELSDEIENLNLSSENPIKGQYDVVLDNEKYLAIIPKTYLANNYFSSTTNLGDFNENDFLSKSIVGKFFIIIDKTKSPFDRMYKIFGYFQLEGGEYIKMGSPNKKYESLDFSPESLGDLYGVVKLIQEFIQKKYSKEIKLMKDPYLREKFIELNKSRNSEIEKQNREILRQQDAWFGTEIGNEAYAVYQYLDDDLKNQYNIKDLYDLYPDSWGDYYLNPQREGENFRVLDENNMEKEVRNHYEAYTEDNLDSFDTSFLESYIDKYRVKDLIESIYREMIDDSPSDWLDKDEFVFDDDTSEKIYDLKNELSNLKYELENSEISDDERDNIEREIERVESEIEDIEENAEKLPTEQQIDNFIYDKLREVDEDPIDELKQLGLDPTDFVNVDDLIDYLVRTEDWDVVASYDGNVDNFSVNNKTYYVYRLE